MTPDNPALAGYKVYSQNEEDGIIEEICERLGVSQGTFIEIGCGNGLENNTHYLLLKGWNGAWVDGSLDNIRFIEDHLPLQSTQLLVLHESVTKDSMGRILGAISKHTGQSTPDFVSLDIDGNDLDVIEKIVSLIKPKLLCVEYNAKFPPPTVVRIRYNVEHVWHGDDYFGASLQAFVDALSDYLLVCCNISGSNAFFVRRDLAGSFTQYAVRELYQPPRYHLSQMRVGHASSLKFLRDVLG